MILFVTGQGLTDRSVISQLSGLKVIMRLKVITCVPTNNTICTSTFKVQGPLSEFSEKLIICYYERSIHFL